MKKIMKKKETLLIALSLMASTQGHATTLATRHTPLRALAVSAFNTYFSKAPKAFDRKGIVTQNSFNVLKSGLGNTCTVRVSEVNLPDGSRVGRAAQIIVDSSSRGDSFGVAFNVLNRDDYARITQVRVDAQNLLIGAAFDPEGDEQLIASTLKFSRKNGSLKKLKISESYIRGNGTEYNPSLECTIQ